MYLVQPTTTRSLNSIQTNGPLVDDEWAAFLRQQDFVRAFAVQPHQVDLITQEGDT